MLLYHRIAPGDLLFFSAWSDKSIYTSGVLNFLQCISTGRAAKGEDHDHSRAVLPPIDSRSEHIRFATQSGIPWMVLVGESEMREGEVKLKDIGVHREEEVPRKDFAQALKRRINN